MYGIIGYPLSHSFSPGYFNEKFKSLNLEETYRSFPMKTLATFKDWLRDNPQLKGLNVTIPHKQAVLAFLDDIDTTALAVGAVNCIKIKENKLKGFNTDVIGFTRTLQPLLSPSTKNALILGTGGASKAVAYSLRQMDIPYQLVSRSRENAHLTYNDLDEELIKQHQLIINTTPSGMSPHTDSCPSIPYHFLNRDHLLYDLIYNPEETLFLQNGKTQGAQIKNGYDMLIAQAEASWEIWNT